MRILIGLTEVSGFGARLKQGFDELGVDAVHISLQPHRFVYSAPGAVPAVVRWSQACVAKRVGLTAKASLVERAWWLAAVTVSRALLLVWALAKFDVFILGAGSSFFAFREFPLLRLLGKRLIYTLHGTDARPPYIDGFFEPEHYGIGTDIAAKAPVDHAESVAERAARLARAHALVAKLRRRQVHAAERYAHFVVCAPNYSHFLVRPFVSFYAIGIPLPAGGAAAPPPVGQGGRVRVLHAPSYLSAKGTDTIRSVVRELQARGMPIDYAEISGRPNTEVLAEIAASDLVIDQLYSDTPMAGFAGEAAMLGKPAVVGGYYARLVHEHLPEAQIPPTAYCLPESLSSTLAAMIAASSERKRLGDAARHFVATNWSARAVASRFVRLAEGSAAPEWVLDPARITYLQGAGLSEEQARANIAAIVATEGVEALQLFDKPELEKRFVRFAEGAGGRC